MEKFSLEVPGIPVSVSVSRFSGREVGDEYHLSLVPFKLESFEIQSDWLSRSYMYALDAIGIAPGTAVFRRFFCSDLVNQASMAERTAFLNPANCGDSCAVSLVCQPPGPSARVSLWAYHIRDSVRTVKKMHGKNSFSAGRSKLTHYWTTGATCPEAEAVYEQTLGILEKYDSFLRANGMSMADNVMRTWFFIQNIDADYRGFVAARRDFFHARGLTEKTHFIASTGVQGSHSDSNVKVAMDAYAVSGLSSGQVDFLSAPEYLSSTSVYGVTFERGISIAYRDRKHVIISGTASIDSKGNILHQGDVMRQLDRTMDNIEALLQQAGATLEDMAFFIVYVRDPVDHVPVLKRMRERFGDTPTAGAWAPVCRPGWLVEVEGIAIVPVSSPEFPAF